MAKLCILCNKEIPSNAEICPICGMSQNMELPKCRCKGHYFKGTDFCPHCSRPISKEARNKRKNEEYLKEQKFSTEIQTLKRQLSEEQVINKKLNDDKIEVSKKNHLEGEQSNKIKNQEQPQLPQWIYIISCIVAVVLLVILILVIFGIL